MMREFLMLAQTYDPHKHDVGGWFVSVKYDGIRCFWDGGVTRGVPKVDVPWANNERDRSTHICTGLWTRYGNVIHAPSWWLDTLPVGIPLDGELWIDRGSLEKTKSYVSKHKPVDAEWREVQYLVFDEPSPHVVFESGTINNPNYRKTISQSDCKKYFDRFYCVLHEFKDYVKRINITETPYRSVDQVQLPYNREQARDKVYELLVEETDNGGEGLMLRHPHSVWTPNRSRHLLKVKKLQDDEAIVLGYTWGVGKYEGLMGAITVKWRGVTFQLSGFTDEERQMYRDEVPYKDTAHPGGIVPGVISNPKFPVGSKIRFRYAGLTREGIPREARYYR